MTVTAAPQVPDGRFWRLLGGALLTFAGLFTLSVMLPHDPYVRYQQLAPTIQFRVIRSYERIVYDPTPIDIAFIGNSRVQAAVRAPLLADELSRRLGRPVHVENLALPQEGRNAQSVIAGLLLAHHPEVKLIVLSAIEQMPRDSHPAFRNIATVGEVFAAPPLVNRDYVTDIAYLPYRQLSLFAQTLAPSWFGTKPGFNPKDYAGTSFDTTASFRNPTGSWIDREATHGAGELRAAARARVEGIHPPVLPARFAGIEFAMERVYTRRIADRARANGTRIGFLYLPIFENHASVQAAGFYRHFGPILDARFLADDAVNYSDYGHLNRTGSLRLTEWLADRMPAMLTGQVPGSSTK